MVIKSKLALTIIILLSCALNTSFNASKSQAKTTQCTNGVILSDSVLGAPPISGIPTYDYGTDGLVQFHFSFTEPGWGMTNMTITGYDKSCAYLNANPIDWTPTLIPLSHTATNITIKAMESSPGHFYFIGYNTDTLAPIDVSQFFPGWLNLSYPIINITLVRTEFVYPTYRIRAIQTPAVPYKKQINTKTPVLIIPGVLGTDILKNNTILWADILRMLNPLNSDSFMDPLGFNSNLEPLDYSLTKGDVIKKKTKSVGNNDVTLYDYTDSLIEEFKAQGYEEGKDLFTFPYDWRYGVSESNVAQLQGQVEYILGQTDAGKVDVVAHSTGGLLAKKYIYDHPSNHGVGKLVYVGVPNVGSPKAFKVLINGDNFGIPGLDGNEMKKISQNMPVVYDLAPSSQYPASFMHVHNPFALNAADREKDLSYSSAIQALQNLHLLNTTAVANSQALHSSAFDTYDVRTAGVDSYNIIGCKTATFGNFTQSINLNSPPTFDFPKITTGDGTVPVISSQTIPTDPSHTFFAPKSDHGKLPSTVGIRQQIVNVITGSTLSTGGKILTHDQVTQNPSLCRIKGEYIHIKSPVEISAQDQNGNNIGLAEDGSIENEIPGAEFEIWGDHKYLFLPTDEGETYTVTLKGTGNGTFTLLDQTITDNNYNDDNNGARIAQTRVFSNIPVSNALTGTLDLETNKIVLDTNGDGTNDKTIAPSSIIGGDQSLDTTAPTTIATINGTQGQSGYYRSNVTIALSATDLIIPGHESETSGVLSTSYKLDNDTTYTTVIGPISPISISTEGTHTLTYFSTDKAGNNEAVQTKTFTIDKTPLEVRMQWNETLKDIQFTALNGTAPAPAGTYTMQDANGHVVFTDLAGNTTDLTFAQTNRRSSLRAELTGIAYNSVPTDFRSSKLLFYWLYDKNGKLTALYQYAGWKNTFNISAIYLGKNTILAGTDNGKLITKIIPGLTLLKVATHKGSLNWGY